MINRDLFAEWLDGGCVRGRTWKIRASEKKGENVEWRLWMIRVESGARGITWYSLNLISSPRTHNDQPTTLHQATWHRNINEIFNLEIKLW